MGMNIKLCKVASMRLGERIGQLRAIPVDLGPQKRGILLIHGPDFDVDPAPGMFFFPSGTLKMTMLSLTGELLWQRDLGPGLIPGLWFCPFYAIDLDGGGTDAIYFVNQTHVDHPLSYQGFVLECASATDGKTLSQTPWHDPFGDVPMYAKYRNFVLGGTAAGRPVLVAAQGTYATMALQAYVAGPTGLERLWNKRIEQADAGARGSHMCPVVDLDGDGIDEILWGERCIRISDGQELFCADRDTYCGHSDIMQPTLDRKTGLWRLWTCRENHGEATPRLCCYDAKGNRLWGDVDAGHMDMGWTAHVREDLIACMGVRISGKSCGPGGRFHERYEQFIYSLVSGEKLSWPVDLYKSLPVDIDGDGYHEFVMGAPGGNGRVFDADGNEYGTLGGPAALAMKFLDLPGEQLLIYQDDGTVSFEADANAHDTDAALARYGHRMYLANRKLTACGYNWTALGGL
jgi:hypothetical protein